MRCVWADAFMLGRGGFFSVVVYDDFHYRQVGDDELQSVPSENYLCLSLSYRSSLQRP